ncbi:hypothetical protein B0J18DRAFT_406182 [Chaetomium sp. MPI-SDFR-AT-0129]|nr:hypothetical protein B0J18DRAFT_406182 [Chaetomium sp. MPI-SDFR-AT-0129]
MLVKSIAALAALTFAANVAAEPMPYKPTMMKASARSLFGLMRRDDHSGYQPEQTMCGDGNTCAEACGAGYETCSSVDSQIHCFNPAAGELCCPDKSGNTCEAGYYCAADVGKETWCCPDGMDLAACAAAYSVTSGLVSQTPPPATSTSTSTSKSSSKTTSTKTKHSSTTSTTSTSTKHTSTSASTTSFSSSSISLLPSSSIIPANTTAVSSVQIPQPTESHPTEGAGNNLAIPASALVLLAAGFAALL